MHVAFLLLFALPTTLGWRVQVDLTDASWRPVPFLHASHEVGVGENGTNCVSVRSVALQGTFRHKLLLKCSRDENLCLFASEVGHLCSHRFDARDFQQICCCAGKKCSRPVPFPPHVPSPLWPLDVLTTLLLMVVSVLAASAVNLLLRHWLICYFRHPTFLRRWSLASLRKRVSLNALGAALTNTRIALFLPPVSSLPMPMDTRFFVPRIPSASAHPEARGERLRRHLHLLRSFTRVRFKLAVEWHKTEVRRALRAARQAALKRPPSHLSSAPAADQEESTQSWLDGEVNVDVKEGPPPHAPKTPLHPHTPTLKLAATQVGSVHGQAVPAQSPLPNSTQREESLRLQRTQESSRHLDHTQPSSEETNKIAIESNAPFTTVTKTHE